MLMAGTWSLNQENTILFVLVDQAGQEVPGLGLGFTLEIGRRNVGFAVGQGTKFEIGDGHYGYEATAAEAAVSGPLTVKITHPSIIQQNLEYVVETRAVNAVQFTYTVTSSLDSSPIPGVTVIITSDIGGNTPIWRGTTDAAGVARQNGELPWLDPGTYYLWRSHPSYTFTDPDTEVVA